MVVEDVFDEQDAFRCEVCGFHFETRETAQQCEDYCTTHDGCSTELAKQALETGE